MVTKVLSCSVSGTVVGRIEYNNDAISDAIAAAIEGRAGTDSD